MARKRANRPARERDVGPTPETAAKLRQDTILILGKARFLTPEGVNSARRIKAIYLAVVGGLMPSRSRAMAESLGRYEIPDELADEHRFVYLPWARSIDRQTLGMVIDLVIDGRVTECEPAARRVLDAIERYSEFS